MTRPRLALLPALVAALGTPVAGAAPFSVEDKVATETSGAAAVAPPVFLQDRDPEMAAGPWSARLFPFLATGEPVGFAPARWGGTLAVDHLEQRSGDAASRYSTAASMSLTAASYFWQPWFAQVRGNLTLLASDDRGGANESAGAPDASSRALSLSGGGSVTIFPNSRFPFHATIDSTDSRATGDFTPSDFRSTRATVRQSWRDALGGENAAAGADFSRLDSRSFGRDTVFALDGRYQRATETWRGDAVLGWSRNRREAGEGADITRFFATHLYTPNPDLWVHSLASFTESDLHLATEGGDLAQRVLQATSQAVWRPGWDERLAFTGGGRVLANGVERTGVRDDSSAVSGNAGFSFAARDDVTLQGSVTTTRLAADSGGTQLLAFESLGANYTPRPVDLAVASWSPSVAIQGAHESGAQEGPRHLASAQADQQFTKGLPLGASTSLNLVFAQGAGLVDDSVVGRTTVLRYNGTVGVRADGQEGSDGYLGAGYGESRATGAIEERFRLANVQSSGQIRLGVYGLLTGNLTAQWIRTLRETSGSRESARQLFGSVTYQHSRVFGVPRLRFLTTATFNQGLTESRLLGDAEAPRETVTRLVDSRFLYDIGRLELRIGMRLAQTDGRTDRQLYLRIARQFGQF